MHMCLLHLCVQIVYEDTAAELLGVSNNLPGPFSELPLIGKQ
jgi:hypothetical protein